MRILQTRYQAWDRRLCQNSYRHIKFAGARCAIAQCMPESIYQLD